MACGISQTFGGWNESRVCVLRQFYSVALVGLELSIKTRCNRVPDLSTTDCMIEVPFSL